MKTLFFFIILFQISAAASTIHLSLGEERVLPLKNSGSVWIQDRKILKATAAARGLQIKGLQEGVTTLKIGKEIHQVQVFHPQNLSLQEGFGKEVRRIIGLQLVLKEGRLWIKGRLYRWADWLSLKELAEKFGVDYKFAAEISAPLRETSLQEVSALIKKSHLPAQTLLFEPQPELRVSSSELYFKKYKELLSPFGIEITKDENSLDLAPTIKVQITVAEVKRSLNLQYGIQWPAGFAARVVPKGLERTEDLIFNAKAFEEQGYGKILASPNILCRSGKEAEFLAGGEFPIKILNYKIQDIVWKRYGILLRVKPKADTAGRMSLSIETEISTIDKSMSVDGIPGILTNRVSSHFDLSKPQTIALSGLLKSEEGKAAAGLPFLSRLPILGPLFSSTEFREAKTELVIFVRPTIMDENDPGVNENQHLGNLQERKW